MRWSICVLVCVASTSLAAEPVCPKTAKDPFFDLGPCDKKPVAACLAAGDKLIATPGCRAEALQRYDTACTRKELRGCSKKAFRLVENSRDAKVVEQAIALFTRACDGGDALGCSNLASFAWDGEGMPKDAKKAATFAEKACTAGDAFACGLLGSLYGQGELGKADPAKAFELFSKACTGGSASGCNQLGMAWAQGQGTTKDIEKAMATWNGACHQKNAAACANMGKVLRAKNDHAQAEKAFAKACKLGDAEACADRDVPPDE